MKKYVFGFVAIVLAIGFSAFTKPAKESLFVDYVFKYIGPLPSTDAQVKNRDNWRIQVLTPLLECTNSDQEVSCSFETAPNASYITLISGDVYKPSTSIEIMTKNSSLGGTNKVVNFVKKVSDGVTVSTDVDNVPEP